MKIEDMDSHDEIIHKFINVAKAAKVIMVISDREHYAWVALREAVKELEKD